MVQIENSANRNLPKKCIIFVILYVCFNNKNTTLKKHKKHKKIKKHKNVF